MSKIYKYYLTESSKEDILSGYGWFWEEKDEDGLNVFTQDKNLAKSWNSVEELNNDIKVIKYKIALFGDDVFIKFL